MYHIGSMRRREKDVMNVSNIGNRPDQAMLLSKQSGDRGKSGIAQELKEKDSLIFDLQQATREIKTLQGIIPIFVLQEHQRR